MLDMPARSAWTAALVPALLLLPTAAVSAARNLLPPILGPEGLLFEHGGRPLPTASGTHVPQLKARTLELEVVGEASPHLFQSMAFGDSDHDGWLEAGLYIQETIGSTTTYTYRIYETQGEHLYTEVQTGPALVPYALGTDADADGLAEIIGQWSHWLYVYESSATDGHPDHLVWQSDAMSNIVGYATYADVDSDGKYEILHTVNQIGGPSYLLVFESGGNDVFSLVYQAYLAEGAGGEKVVADFDDDGRREIATSTLFGRVAVFENTSDDRYVETWTTNLGTENAYAVALGHDMDGNGKLELVIGGSSESTGYVTKIFESDGDNSFTLVQTIAVFNGFFGMPYVVTGDLDGDEKDELVVETGYEIRVYKADGVGSYVQVAHIPQPAVTMNGIVCADGNRDGVDELYWESAGSLGAPGTLIYQAIAQTGVECTELGKGIRPITAAPNPFRSQTRIQGPPDAKAISIYDIGGRLVQRIRGSEHVWDGRNAHGSRLRAGVYFLSSRERIRGDISSSGKVVLLPE